MKLEEAVVSQMLTISHLLQLIERCLSLENILIHFWLTAEAEAEAEAEVEAEVEAYCRQSAGTIIPGIEPRWNPWP
jgi:phytoene/squalene synthetase